MTVVGKGHVAAAPLLELPDPGQIPADPVPVLDPAHFDGAILLPDDGHIDVHELLWSYIRNAKAKGVELQTNAEVKNIVTENGGVKGVVTGDGEIGAKWVVNAAGAWAGVQTFPPSPTM